MPNAAASLLEKRGGGKKETEKLDGGSALQVLMYVRARGRWQCDQIRAQEAPKCGHSARSFAQVKKNGERRIGGRIQGSLSQKL